MASRTIQVPTIAWESPLHEQGNKWLESNGIDTNLIPLESEIVVTDETITFEAVVPNGKGGYVVVPGEERLLRETVTVPKKSAPEAYGI